MLRILLLALLPFLTACLEFDGQELTLHYDAELDRLDVLLVYRGVYLSRPNPKDDLEDIDRVLRTGTFALWSTFPVSIDLTERKPRSEAFADHCEVENGGFFTDPCGVLCAWQLVRIHDVRGMLELANERLAGWVQRRVLELEPGQDRNRFDAESRRLLQDVAAGRQQVLSRQGGAFVLTLPCSDSDHERLMQRFSDDLHNAAARMMTERLWRTRLLEVSADGKEAATADPESSEVPLSTNCLLAQRAMDAAPESRFLLENPIGWQRLEGRTIVTVGWPHRTGNVLRKQRDGKYVANLEALLREHEIPVEVGVPDQELGRRFAAFHGRDAVLPPDLALQR